MGRFRSSSLGSGAIILGFLLVVFHRYGTGLLFLVVGAALLWYGRMQREARERAETRASEGEGAPQAQAEDGAGAREDEGAGRDDRGAGEG